MKSQFGKYFKSFTSAPGMILVFSTYKKYLSSQILDLPLGRGSLAKMESSLYVAYDDLKIFVRCSVRCSVGASHDLRCDVRKLVFAF
jgi:hypothetical protein